MISPLIAEEEWLISLAGIPAWLPPRKHTVVIAPHPDDETLGAGGLIAYQRGQGIVVTIIAVTDGEAAFPDAGQPERQGLAIIRQAEQERALETLGVAAGEITRLRLPDSAVSGNEHELQSYLARVVKADSLVVAPWPSDWHPDHEACGRAAMEAAKAVGAELVFYLFWTWHCRTPECLSGERLLGFELQTKLLDLKQRALNCHKSQLEHESAEPILPERFLGPARRSFETFVAND